MQAIATAAGISTSKISTPVPSQSQRRRLLAGVTMTYTIGTCSQTANCCSTSNCCNVPPGGCSTGSDKTSGSSCFMGTGTVLFLRFLNTLSGHSLSTQNCFMGTGIVLFL